MFAYGFVLMSFVTLLTLWSEWHVLWKVSLLEGTNNYLRGSKGWLFKPPLNWCRLLLCQEKNVLLHHQAGWWGSRVSPSLEWNRNRVNLPQQLGGDYGGWGGVLMCCFFLVSFSTTIQIFASFSQPKLLSDWHIWSVTAYHTMCGINQGALQCPRIQYCCLTKRKKTRSPGLFKL